MNLATKTLFLFAATAAYAQHPSSPQGTIQHVIVIIQENRTVDNLFGSNPVFAPGVNIATSGKIKGQSNITLTPAVLNDCIGIGHAHKDFTAAYDNGAMDGAYGEGITLPKNCTAVANPMYRFADNSISTFPPNEVQPFFDIARQFGFANYMFQTNQGPSFPAHLFLFAGTSAPVYNDGEATPYYQWFVAENPVVTTPTGCFGAINPPNVALEISPAGKESAGWRNLNLPGAVAGYPCYNHNTIATLLDPAGISWRYYTNDVKSIWTAPNAFQAICNAKVAGGGCVATPENPDWNYVVQESVKDDPPNPAQILQDIKSCELAQVSFVTPDGAWSDHAGNGPANPALGPSWVADIVNAIGQGMVESTCNPLNAPIYWNNTVILVTWDDWGGWYDHVKPPILGYLNSHGSGTQYVYGFRVPLLVVSAYSPTPGYVSGPAISNAVTSCPISPNSRYCHDFGSILNFIEYVFGKGGKSLGEIDSVSHYADYYALDGPYNIGCKPAVCPYSLSDFFNFGLPPAHFTPISVPYDSDYFLDYSGEPRDADDD
ncbi:MAG: alkaline phosphatase family protein [Candidatus Sulfotelmatobacter sp.]